MKYWGLRQRGKPTCFSKIRREGQSMSETEILLDTATALVHHGSACSTSMVGRILAHHGSEAPPGSSRCQSKRRWRANICPGAASCANESCLTRDDSFQ